MSSSVFIGIDTSNYTTSVAAVDSAGHILSDRRTLLTVKEGERGLRQQEALFQHVNNLPVLIKELMEDIQGCSIEALACSTKPRPRERSYMPCFIAGSSEAESISEVLGCRLYEFSHQEGHVVAASKDTLLAGRDDYVFFHLSGGTTEAVELPGYDLVGKTLDISFGQLIDRAGVALGMRFPCGRELDELALSYDGEMKNNLPRIKAEDGEVNLSGIESACLRMIKEEGLPQDGFARMLFDRIAEALCEMTGQISEKTGKTDFLFAGGVSSSKYIRNRMREMLDPSLNVYFGRPELCRDNAVGTALLGGRRYGAEADQCNTAE